MDNPARSFRPHRGLAACTGFAALPWQLTRLPGIPPFPVSAKALLCGMRTTFRFLLIAAVVVALLGSIGAGVASWWFKDRYGADFWVGLIEKDTNCRAEIS